MDAVYSAILRACDWSDADFRNDYGLVMGAILAAKTPLSISALQSLHRGNPTPCINEVIPHIGALLVGWKHAQTPVQILHLSLRDFLTTRAKDSADTKPFYISEKEHNQRLAVLSLAVLNEDLTKNTSGVGYLNRELPGIPVVTKGMISEELWYASKFWMVHAVECEAPVPGDLVGLVRKFISTQLPLWIELSTALGGFNPIQPLRAWIQVSIIVRYLHLAHFSCENTACSARTHGLY